MGCAGHHKQVELIEIPPCTNISGSIQGTITDQDTGEPVIGATVEIEGTTTRMQTNINGQYQFCYLIPGTYSVRFNSIQHNTVEVTDIGVQTGVTLEINHTLTKKISNIDKVIIVKGKADISNAKEVANKITSSSERIKAKPVTTVDALLSQVAGVQTNTAGEVFIRGGRRGKIEYIKVDLPDSIPNQTICDSTPYYPEVDPGPGKFGGISGQIINHKTGIPIVGASVRVVGLEGEVLTDSLGMYSFKCLGISYQSIIISAGGYLPIQVDSLLVPLCESLEVNRGLTLSENIKVDTIPRPQPHIIQ